MHFAEAARDGHCRSFHEADGRKDGLSGVDIREGLFELRERIISLRREHGVDDLLDRYCSTGRTPFACTCAQGDDVSNETQRPLIASTPLQSTLHNTSPTLASAGTSFHGSSSHFVDPHDYHASKDGSNSLTVALPFAANSSGARMQTDLINIAQVLQSVLAALDSFFVTTASQLPSASSSRTTSASSKKTGVVEVLGSTPCHLDSTPTTSTSLQLSVPNTDTQRADDGTLQTLFSGKESTVCVSTGGSSEQQTTEQHSRDTKAENRFVAACAAQTVANVTLVDANVPTAPRRSSSLMHETSNRIPPGASGSFRAVGRLMYKSSSTASLSEGKRMPSGPLCRSPRPSLGGGNNSNRTGLPPPFPDLPRSNSVVSTTWSVASLPLSQRHAFQETRSVRIGRDDVGMKTINEYVILRLLGRGSQGKVKLAQHTTTGQLVAIKIYNKSPHKQRWWRAAELSAQRRMETEIEIMKDLKHRHVVQLFEVIDDPSCNKMYMVMQFVNGGSIATLSPMTRRCRIIAPNRVVRIARQAIAGLRYLHRRGIMHRDIKPENILCDDAWDRSEDGGQIFLSDFGVAVMFEGGQHDAPPDLTGTIGTPLFFSPEIFARSAVSIGPPADVWALGVTVYCLLFGRPPFGAGGKDTAHLSIAEEVQTLDVSFPPFNYGDDDEEEDDELVVEVTDDMRSFFSRTLEKDPVKRITLAELRKHPWILNGSSLTGSMSGSLGGCGESSVSTARRNSSVWSRATLPGAPRFSVAGDDEEDVRGKHRESDNSSARHGSTAASVDETQSGVSIVSALSHAVDAHPAPIAALMLGVNGCSDVSPVRCPLAMDQPLVVDGSPVRRASIISRRSASSSNRTLLSPLSVSDFEGRSAPAPPLRPQATVSLVSVMFVVVWCKKLRRRIGCETFRSLHDASFGVRTPKCQRRALPLTFGSFPPPHVASHAQEGTPMAIVPIPPSSLVTSQRSPGFSRRTAGGNEPSRSWHDGPSAGIASLPAIHLPNSSNVASLWGTSKTEKRHQSDIDAYPVFG